MYIAVAVFALVSALSAAAEASSFTTRASPSPTARVYGSANPPYGFVRLCLRLPDLCQPNSVEMGRVTATPVALAELEHVNQAVNRAVAPVSDKEQFGVDEYWTLPTSGKGDCEEYVLEKRRLLMERRWPSGALLITVVIDENQQGHAILTARMDTGDLTLDNKHDEIRPWYASPYEYIMRQSFVSPTAWVSLAPMKSNPPAVAADRNRSGSR